MSNEVTIASHWGVHVGAVTVITEAAHGGWVARASVDLGHRTERFSETGLEPDAALSRLVDASLHRAAAARGNDSGRAPVHVA